MAYILWFEDIGDDDLSLVGGKGLNLGKMVNQGFPIPPGYAITAEMYFDFIEETGIKEKIRDLLEDLDVEDTEKLQNASEKIEDLFLEEDIADKFKDAMWEPFKKINEDNEDIHLAIRSSATAEDLPDASFAGQQETYLGVDKENYIESVLKCWASLFTARAIYYRENNDFSHMDVGISVIVQKLIDAKVAGVVFTVHPSSGENMVMIEAGLGLGETVVSGSITPDTYKVNPDDWSIEDKNISNQSFKIIRKKNETKKIDLSEKEGNQQKLPDDDVKKLAKICKDIEDYYGDPQDIEWAKDKKLYILQSRPITTLKEKEEASEGKTVDMEEAEAIVKGLAASPGLGGGKAKYIKDSSQLSKVKKGDVLITSMTTPDMVPAMKRAAAIATDEGGMTSHAAIVSRELGVPCVVGTSKVTKKIEDGQEITVDGDKGIVYDGLLQEELEEQEESRESEKVSRSALITGTHIYVNLSSPSAAKETAKRNVDGVGLFRAEFIAAQIGDHPQKAIKEGRGDEWSDELSKGIRKVVNAFNPKPVVYRTLDFKTNEYRELPGGEIEPEENNPMLGFRGCYRNIKSQRVFELELRAIKKVRDEHNLKNLYVMLPFVRTLSELKKAIGIMNNNGLERGRDFKLWVMVEVPSTVFLIEDFLEYVDGVSMGTNDLTQLTLGVDRDNEHLSEIFDERDPAVLKAVEQVINACNKKGKTVSVCGQAPSVYPEFVEFLVEKGVTSVSVNPDAIERTRRLIASTEQKFMLNRLRNIKNL